MNNIIKSYLEHDLMTRLGSMKNMVTDIPKDINTIVTYVQNILVHQHWSEAYGLVLSPERTREPFIRSFAEKLIFLNKQGYTHVSEQKPVAHKMVAICRDFSLVAAALCREAGIPARARCGFATYFEKGKYYDHWVLEYWHEENNNWIMADAQLDEVQAKALELRFDPLDVSKEYFITGPCAWILCREGKLDPEVFGIFKWWGYDYLRCNLILDVNALLKKPMQPWDMWEGYKKLPLEHWTETDYAVMDELAMLALNVDDHYESLYNFVQSSSMIEVPSDLNKVYNRLLEKGVN